MTRATVGVAALALNALALGCLLILHGVSPEFDPSWRMISEYARGGSPGLLAAFFAAWGLGTGALVWGLAGLARTPGFRVGLVLLVASGAGELLASVFDISHPLHDLAGYLGILCLPVGALLIHRGLARPDSGAVGASHFGAALAPLGALVVFVATFVVLMVTYASSGATVDPSAVNARLPDGVVALVGWANRVLVLAFLGWASLLGWRALVRPRTPEGAPQ